MVQCPGKDGAAILGAEPQQGSAGVAQADSPSGRQHECLNCHCRQLSRPQLSRLLAPLRLAERRPRGKCHPGTLPRRLPPSAGRLSPSAAEQPHLGMCRCTGGVGRRMGKGEQA